MTTCNEFHDNMNGLLHTWNGDSTIANWEISGGSSNSNTDENKIFDGDDETFWHSKHYDRDWFQVDFIEPIDFTKIVIRKRWNWHGSRYNNTCLVLDGIDYDCTIQNNGQNGGPYIIWEVPKRFVKNIKVDFRSDQGLVTKLLKL